SDYLAEWIPYREDFMDSILAREAAVQPVTCRECQGTDNGLYRCLYCLTHPVYCGTHMREFHELTPFHRIEVWTGTYFEPSWLSDTGLKIFLGHAGFPCSEIEPADFTDVEDSEDSADEGTSHSKKDQFVPEDIHPMYGHRNRCWIVDVSGIHSMEVVFCDCANHRDKHLQLLDMDLWPASFKRIKTLFTFRLLSDFRLENLEAKTSAYHYFSKLRRVTNPAFPNTVPDRYRELLRVSREWRNILLRKWQGFGHTGEQPSSGSLALFCPSCPQPGINLPENWEKDKKKFVYSRQFVMDGNFTASHIEKAGKKDNVWLMDGEAFMTHHTRYHEHLKDKPEEEPRSTCHNHCAQLDQNIGKQGRDVTGIGATACARHGAFCPASVVDFQKGERQVNMDFSLTEAISHTNVLGLVRAVTLYDINCQFWVYFMRRAIDKGLFWPKDLMFEPAIGLFHVHGHKEICNAQFSPSYIRGIGRTDGEVLETLWSTLNDGSRSVQTASLAHRAETLDDLMIDSNWKKLLRGVDQIRRRYNVATGQVPEAKTYLMELSKNIAIATQKRWEKEVTAAENNRLKNLDGMNIYLPNISQAPGLIAQVDALVAENAADESTLKWLSDAIQLQEDQRSLRADVRRGMRVRMSKTQSMAFERKAHAIEDRLEQHYQKAARLIGQKCVDEVRSKTVPVDEASEDEEDEMQEIDNGADWYRSFKCLWWPICLPSAYAQTAQEKKRQESRLEAKLRRGQLNQVIRSLRGAINQKYFWGQSKRRKGGNKHIREGYDQNAKQMQDSINNLRRGYVDIRKALLHLDPSAEAEYKALEPKDVRIPSWMIELNSRHARDERNSWIWQEYSAEAKDDEEGECNRLSWLKARAQYNRWKEELTLLEYEMQWTVRWFMKKQVEWKGHRNMVKGKPGHIAYACRQIAMWAKFEATARKEFQLVKPDFAI
ncbi:hypothetical protein BDN72DRAFT_780133, partial [Pluteus cervinus]